MIAMYLLFLFYLKISSERFGASLTLLTYCDGDFFSQQNRTGVSEPALRVRATRPQETEAAGERAEGSGGHQQNRL